VVDFKKPRYCKECPGYFDPCLQQGEGDNPAHIIVVGVSPSGFSIGEKKSFYGRDGRLFKNLLKRSLIQYNEQLYDSLKLYYTYATMVGEYKPTTEHVQCCQSRLIREISDIKKVKGSSTPVIVTLGPLALKAVGVYARKITDVAGRVLETTINTHLGPKKYKVVPILSMEHISTKRGTTNVMLIALAKAVAIAIGESGKATKETSYIYPKTGAEVEELVDDIINYYDDENSKTGPDHHPIALDTETNTLYPYSEQDPKTLMLSVAWERGKAATILLDHPEAPYKTEEERAQVWRSVKRLLLCPKPKIFHNWKFDHKFIERVNGIPVNRVAWDTMLGEHYIDEDKKGHYKLKQLTPIYAPAYQGYDDELQEIFRSEKERAAVRLKNKDIIEEADKGWLPPICASNPKATAHFHEFVSVIKEYQRIGKIPRKARTTQIQQKFEKNKAKIQKMRKEFSIGNATKKAPKSLGTGNVAGFTKIPLDTILEYAASDADVTWIIAKKQLRRLAKAHEYYDGLNVMKRLYIPASKPLSDMEYRGFKIDMAHLDSLEKLATERLERAQSIMAKSFSASLNLNGPAQISAFMGKLGFEPLPGIAYGSTSKENLEIYKKHYAEDDPRHIFADNLLLYRESEHTLKTFIHPIRAYSKKDGKIHCSFNLNGTATGRLSSSSPNLQNIPMITARRVEKLPNGEKKIIFPGFNVKKLFIPSKPRNVIVNCDISGAELRVFTAYSHDDDMITAIINGMDIHSFTTSKVYGIPYETVLLNKDSDPDIKKKRLAVKRLVFGILYGAGPTTLAAQVGCSFEEAKQQREYLFQAFPKIRSYVDDTALEVEERQWVKTFFGRKRRFKIVDPRDRYSEYMADAKREAVNFKIQSTSSDLVLSQLIEIDKHLGELDGQLLVTVHDSYVLELPEENVPKLFPFFDKYIVERIKEKYSWLPVPFSYDLEYGPSYGELREAYRQEEHGMEENHGAA